MRCLFLSGWISVLVSEFYAVEVQHGDKVTLQCSNFSIFPSHIYWFKLARLNATCISSMMSADRNPALFDGFDAGKFNMTSNTSVLFLEIKRVDFSDSGLYFCGEYNNGKSTIVSETYLKVQGKNFFFVIWIPRERLQTWNYLKTAEWYNDIKLSLLFFL